jgi:hypothetical protein
MTAVVVQTKEVTAALDHGTLLRGEAGEAVANPLSHHGGVVTLEVNKASMVNLMNTYVIN